jgi:hypothetical protein
MLNTTAPNGVPNVAPTPAAAAHASTSSRFASSLATRRNGGCRMSVSAIATAMCTNGPSLPTDSPAE